MKLVLCGKSFVACASLEHVLAVRGALGSPELVCVANQSDRGSDTWEPSFRKLADDCGLLLAPDVASAGLGPGDVLVSLEYDRIIKVSELGGARAYNFHFSLLPAYRGCITSVWPIRNREARSGVTLHVLTAGIDDGPIVAQVAFELGPSLTAYELYREYNRRAFALFQEQLPGIVRGDHPAVAQGAAHATYFGRNSIDFKQKVLRDFDRRAADVSAWVRSLIFPPYQLPEHDGKRIAGIEVLGAAPRRSVYPGTVLAEDEAGKTVMCGDLPVHLRWER